MENFADFGTVWKWAGVAFWFCFIEQKSVGVERPLLFQVKLCFIEQNLKQGVSRGFTLWQDKPRSLGRWKNLRFYHILYGELECTKTLGTKATFVFGAIRFAI